MPATLVSVISGADTQPSLATALGALAAWGVVPAVISLGAVHRRDVIQTRWRNA